MSYSNIKAHFNGNIEIDNAIKDGTAFNIIIPVWIKGLKNNNKSRKFKKILDFLFFLWI